MKNILKSGLSLTLIVLVCCALLVGVRQLTFRPYVFSLTPQDNAAISELTTSTKFGKIEVEAVYIKYVLRVLDGEDTDNYIIRSYADGPRGVAETNTLIDGESGAIKGIAMVSIDRAAHDRLGQLDIDKIFSRYIGKSALDAFTNADGVSLVTETNLALYTAVNNGLKYFSSNASTLRAAEVAEEVSLGEVADILLDSMKVLFPTTTSYEMVISETQPGSSGEELTLTGYLTNDANIIVVVEGNVLYRIGSDSFTYPAALVFKFDENGTPTKNPVDLHFEAMQDYFNAAKKAYEENQSDGSGSGATGTYQFIQNAFAYAAYYYKQVEQAVDSRETVPTAWEVAYE